MSTNYNIASHKIKYNLRMLSIIIIEVYIRQDVTRVDKLLSEMTEPSSTIARETQFFPFCLAGLNIKEQ